MAERESFVVYGSWFKTARKIYKDRDELARFALAIIELGIDGIVPPDDDSPERVAYEIAAKQIEANARRRENGKKGGAPAGNKNAKKEGAEETTEKQPKNNLKTSKGSTEKKANVNVNDNLNVNDNENIKGAVSTAEEKIRLSSGQYWTITPEKIQQYKAVFPRVDVDHEIAVMALTAEEQPDKRRAETRIEQFIVNWLRNADEKAVEQDKTTKEKAEAGKKKNAFHNFDEHEYDFDEIDRMLDLA